MPVCHALTNFQAFTGHVLVMLNWMIGHQHWLIRKWGKHPHIFWHVNALRANLGWFLEHLTYPKHLEPPPCAKSS